MDKRLKKTNKKSSKDSFHAKLSFYLSLGFWIPLFNIGLSIVSLFLAISAIKQYFLDPEEYGGLYYAIIASVLSITSLVLTVIGVIFYVFSGLICTSRICIA